MVVLIEVVNKAFCIHVRGFGYALMAFPNTTLLSTWDEETEFLQYGLRIKYHFFIGIRIYIYMSYTGRLIMQLISAKL